MIKWVQVLPHAALPAAGRGVSFTELYWPKARRASPTLSQARWQLTAKLMSQPLVLCPSQQLPLHFSLGISRSGTRRIFTPSEANTRVSKLQAHPQFYFPPFFPFLLPLTQSSSFRREDAHSTSLSGQDPQSGL